MRRSTKSKIAVTLGLALLAASPAYAVSLTTIFGNLGTTATAFKSMASLIAVAAGVFGVGWGLYQGFIARADDPQISFGKSMMMAVGGGLLAAIAASTNTFQETVFGTTNVGNQSSTSTPF